MPPFPREGEASETRPTAAVAGVSRQRVTAASAVYVANAANDAGNGVGRISWLTVVVVNFTASWCGPCRFITHVLVEIAIKTPMLFLKKVDVDELRLEHRVCNLSRMRESSVERYKSSYIPVNWKLDTGYVSQLLRTVVGGEGFSSNRMVELGFILLCTSSIKSEIPRLRQAQFELQQLKNVVVIVNNDMTLLIGAGGEFVAT
ncbi:hypothetical protein CASFOL_037115 [Castilleja foliolosa]|uniref:Thioredoxin domain-containing protein n=1 Tax=Castilleja foliolosa TaxID=1961234 RepID=A0ABD3BQ92_9LAMI